jgi:dihydroxyacetone kinase-like protein
VQRYGKADVGHKTMVDALSPAVQALTSSLPSDGSAMALRQAAGAAIEGAQSTASIIAKRGRASYVGEVSRGVLDPGAVAMALMIELAANACDGSAAPADSGWVTAPDA